MFSFLFHTGMRKEFRQNAYGTESRCIIGPENILFAGKGPENMPFAGKGPENMLFAGKGPEKYAVCRKRTGKYAVCRRGTEKYTICRHVPASFRPEGLQAGAVKGLKKYVYC